MPRALPDFSKGVIYKITCSDSAIIDCYVGSTVNFKRRKWCHSAACSNQNSRDHNIPVYVFIREHGGWSNWNMGVIESYPCQTELELRARERYFIDQINPSLNVTKPCRTDAEWRAENREYLRAEKKRYAEEHKSHIDKKNHEYYAQHREAILLAQRKQTECECGVIYTGFHGARHERSKHHLQFMALKLACPMTEGLCTQ